MKCTGTSKKSDRKLMGITMWPDMKHMGEI